LKTCTKCQCPTPLEGFSNYYKSKDGLKSQCKLCDSLEYDIAKKAGKIVNGKSNHEAIFKAKHGVSPGTVRSYVNKNYSFLWGELTEPEKMSIIEEYKKFRSRKRVTKGYKVRIK